MNRAVDRVDRTVLVAIFKGHLAVRAGLEVLLLLSLTSQDVLLMLIHKVHIPPALTALRAGPLLSMVR